MNNAYLVHEQADVSHVNSLKNEHMLSNLPPIFRMRLVLRRSWRENAIRTSGGCRLLMNGCAFRRIVDALGRFKKTIWLRLEKTARSSSQPHSAKKFEKMSKRPHIIKKLAKKILWGEQESETQDLENIMTAFITVPADVHHACPRKGRIRHRVLTVLRTCIMLAAATENTWRTIC